MHSSTIASLTPPLPMCVSAAFVVMLAQVLELVDYSSAGTEPDEAAAAGGGGGGGGGGAGGTGGAEAHEPCSWREVAQEPAGVGLISSSAGAVVGQHTLIESDAAAGSGEGRVELVRLRWDNTHALLRAATVHFSVSLQGLRSAATAAEPEPEPEPELRRVAV